MDANGQTVTLTCPTTAAVNITPRTSGTTTNLKSISYNGNYYIAAGENGKAYISDSNGINWTEVTMGMVTSNGQTAAVYPAASSLNAASAVGTIALAAGSANTNPKVPYAYYNTTLSSATGGTLVNFNGEQISSDNITIGDIAAFKNSYVVLGSSSGNTYTGFRTGNGTPPSNQYGWTISSAIIGTIEKAVACKTDQCVMVGAKFRTSNDGTTWTDRDTSAAKVWDVTWSTQANKYIAVGDFGVYTSSDGITWNTTTQSSRYFGVACSDVANNNVCVAIGQGALVYSRDGGVTWNTLPSEVTAPSETIKIVWGNNAFVAVGDSGKVYQITIN